jgi:hypothetical protein
MRYLKVVELALVIAILCGSTALAQCGPDSIIGKWSWSLGGVEFKADHTVTQENPGISAPKNSGTWVQSGETYTWTSSTGTNVCTIKLSADCEQLIVRFPNTTYDITIGHRLQIPAATDCKASCDKNKHLLWDGQSKYPDCVCLCENGWKFDEHGNCMPDASELEEDLSLEAETLQGTKPMKPGEPTQITLSPGEKAKLIARCKGIQQEIRILATLLDSQITLEDDEEGRLRTVNTPAGLLTAIIIEQKKSDLAQLNCEELLKDNKAKKVFEGDSGGSLLSPSSGKSISLKLSLERGPLEVDAIQDYVDLTVETPTASISSSGRNKFAVAYNPDTYQTAVDALENPIVIQPSGGAQSPITLQSGQGIMIDTQGAGPVKPLSQNPAENTNGGSTYVSPDGKDIYGPTGGPIQPAASGAAQGGYPDITGIWYLGGPYDAGRPCQIIHNGNALIFINENGGQSGGEFVDSGTVVASDWQGLQGKISDGGKRIDWSNGSWWVRNSQQGNSQKPSSEGCYQDPFTGEITCVDASGNQRSSASSQGNPQEPSSGGCYQDPFTGEITCVDTSGNPGSSVSGQGDAQGISSGGCYQDPVTGEITCVDSTGTPEDISAPEKGCTTDPSTGETICID